MSTAAKPSKARQAPARRRATLVAPLVTRSNNLVNARYESPFSLMATRLIYACMASIDPRKPLDPMHLFKITADEFGRLFSIDSRKVYEELREAGKNIYAQSVNVRHEDGSYKLTRLVSSMEYIHRAGYLQMRLTPEFGDLLSNLRSHFTTVSLFSVSRINSASAIRIYELISEYAYIGHRTLELGELKALLGLSELYPRFFDFEQRVLKTAVKLINESTEYRISYSLSRRGKAVTHIEFGIALNSEFNVKEKLPPPLTASSDMPAENSGALLRSNPSTWDKALDHLSGILDAQLVEYLRTARVMQQGEHFDLQFPNRVVLGRVAPHQDAILGGLQRICIGRPTVSMQLG